MPVFSPIRMILCICLLVLGGACTKTVSDQLINKDTNKSNGLTTQVKQYPVRFNVGNIQDYNQRIAAKEIAAKDYLRYIYYAAYDSAGREVKRIEQEYTMGNEFGVIKDSLSSGKYTVIMMGTGIPTNIRDDSTLSSMSFNAVSGEVFYKKLTMNIGESDSAISTVKLDRISGRLKLDLTDSLPVEVTNINVTFSSTIPLFYFPATDTAGELGSMSGDLFNNQMDVPGSDNIHQVAIFARDKDGMILYQKLIKNVVIKPNQITILRGSLASSDSTDTNGGTSVTFDPDYAGEPIIKSF